MEITFTVLNIFLFILILLFPGLLLLVLKRRKVKRKGVVYFLIGLIVSVILVAAYAWWIDKSNYILLNYYGFDYYGMTNVGRYLNVAKENIESVKSIEASTMGIGWPLKAIFGYPFMVLYLAIAFIFNKVVFKNGKRNG